MMAYLGIIGLGVLGGLANCLLLQGGWLRPQGVNTDKGWMLSPGFLTPVFLGAIAALVTDFLGGAKLPDDGSRWALAILSGLGGGNVLSSLLQKQETAVLKTQMDVLQQTLASALRPPTTPPAPVPAPVVGQPNLGK